MTNPSKWARGMRKKRENNHVRNQPATYFSPKENPLWGPPAGPFWVLNRGLILRLFCKHYQGHHHHHKSASETIHSKWTFIRLMRSYLATWKERNSRKEQHSPHFPPSGNAVSCVNRYVNKHHFNIPACLLLICVRNPVLCLTILIEYRLIVILSLQLMPIQVLDYVNKTWCAHKIEHFGVKQNKADRKLPWSIWTNRGSSLNT